jgi:hypothetical protein
MAENRPAYVAFPSGLGARGVHGTASPSKARAPVFASLISNGQIPSLSPWALRQTSMSAPADICGLGFADVRCFNGRGSGNLH